MSLGWIPAALTILTFWAVALHGLGAASFWYDEIFNADLALNFPTGQVLHILRTGQPYLPLYLLLLKGWAWLTGARPYMPGLEPAGALEMLLRFPSVAASALMLATLFPLSRRMGVRHPWLAPVLLALHPALMEYARDVRMYPLWALLVLLALLGLTARRPYLWLLAGSAALLTHYFSLFPLGAAALVPFLTALLPRPSSRFSSLLPRLTLPFLPAVLWGLWALPVVAGFSSFATGAPPTPAIFLSEIGQDLLTAGALLAPLGRTLPAAWGYGLLAAAALGWVLLSRSRWGRVGASALILGSLGLFALWQLRPVHHSRYLFWTLPLAAVGLAALIGGCEGREKRGRQPLRAAVRWGRSGVAVVLATVALLWGGRATSTVLVAPRILWHPDFRQATAQVNSRAQAGDRGLTVAAHGIQALRLYRTVVPFVAGPEIGRRVQPEDGARLLTANRPPNGGRLWLLLYQEGAMDPGGVIVGTVEQAGGYRVEMLYSRELRLYAYALPDGATFRPLAPERGVGAVFEGGIVLRGAAVHREERLVPVYLFWELTAPQEKGLTGSVHLVRQVGERPITQWDKPVLNEYWPLPRLPVGELLPDRYELVIPPDLPPGTYLLYALLYDPVTGWRHPLEGDGELAILGTFSWP